MASQETEPVAEQRAKAGQRVDTDALYRAHVRPLYAYIYGKVGNREAAEDLTSDVFVKALTRLDPMREEHSAIAWLYTVAHNVVRDYWRAGQGARIIALDEARGGRLSGLSAPLPDRARQEHTTARANMLLQRLPDNYRRVLSCRILEGLSVAETARRLGISEANVKVLQHRALKRAADLREDVVENG